MSFPNLVPTNEGKAAMLKVIEGDSLVFTRIGLGNGDKPDSIDDLTSMQNLICYGDIVSFDRNGTYATLHWQLDTAKITDEFYWKEYAVFARDSDNNEFIFSYAYDDERPQPLSASDSTSLTMLEVDINIAVGSAENISAVIGEYSAYASKEDFIKHTKNNENPHQVTAEQVGLGNVNNVSTDDATPNFSENKDLVNINSGEVASTLWGKVKKAISTLIKHVENQSNPHNVNCTQISAAAKVHEHSASDITTGTLPVSRGGTGQTSASGILKYLFTDNPQHLTLAQNRYFRVTLPNGTVANIAGCYSNGEVFLGSDLSNDKTTHLHSGGQICFIAKEGTKPWYWYMTQAGNFYPGDSNNQNIGTLTNPVRKVYTQQGVSTASDRKLKRNIVEMKVGQEILDKLSYKSFNFSGSEEKTLGLIAQDVYQIFQELGIHNSSVYTVSVIGNDALKHPELENLTDEQINNYDDSQLRWSLDYEQLANLIFAAFLDYRKETNARLNKIEEKLKEMK